MSKNLVGIGFIVLVIIAAVTYAITKERQIRKLEDELAIVESQVLTDTLTIEAIKVVETVDTAYVIRDKVIDRTDTLVMVRNDTVYAEILRSGTAFFDTTLTPGRNRIKLNMEFDYPDPQLRLMAGYSFYQKPQKRFGVGLFAGAGIGYNRKPDILVGIGLTYQVKSIF